MRRPFMLAALVLCAAGVHTAHAQSALISFLDGGQNAFAFECSVQGDFADPSAFGCQGVSPCSSPVWVYVGPVGVGVNDGNGDDCVDGGITLQRSGNQFSGSLLFENDFTYNNPDGSWGGSVLESVSESLSGIIPNGSLCNFNTDSNYSDSGVWSYTVFNTSFDALSSTSGDFSDYVQNVPLNQLPEPSPLWMMLGGLGGLGFTLARRKLTQPS